MHGPHAKASPSLALQPFQYFPPNNSPYLVARPTAKSTQDNSALYVSKRNQRLEDRQPLFVVQYNKRKGPFFCINLHTFSTPSIPRKIVSSYLTLLAHCIVTSLVAFFFPINYHEDHRHRNNNPFLPSFHKCTASVRPSNKILQMR
jgi:hypothetical protein